MIDTFINDIEDHIFTKRLIYRSIIVVDDANECSEIAEKLDKKTYSAIVVHSIDRALDYDRIDNRIVIMTHDMFPGFIENLVASGNILESSYNLVAFSYTICYETVAEMMNTYLKHTNNNASNTILFEEHFMKYVQLEKDIDKILM